MSSIGCLLWWLLLGGLLGWLASWLFAKPKPVTIEKIVDRPVDRIVEKIVDRPVDKIVEKIVDRPVDRIVEKMVDNPAHLSKIATLGAEVAGIAALKMTIDQLRNAPPKTVEKIVEKIVDRPVEKIVEKIVDRPVDRIVEKVVEKIVDRPVDRIVEKVVEKIVDRPVDRIVEKMVDNPSHLAKIATLSAEVAGIAALKMTIDQMRNAPPKTVEKIVEKIVDRPVDRIVEKVVEKIVDRPVDRIVEKMVDNPSHLAKIATLSAEVAGIAALKMTIDQMRNAPPKTVEKIVEKIVDRPVDRIVEKVVEKIVDRPVDRIVEKVVEKIVDRPVDRIVEKVVDNPSHLAKIATLSAEVAGIAALKMTIDQMRNAPPKTVEKIVEKIVDRPVDRIVEKIVDRPVDRIVEKVVEKIVDRPVDRIVEKVVEKIVDRPVDRVVEKMVDNPVHLQRVRAMEVDVATIAGLKLTISQLQSAPPKIVEKIVEKLVDRPVDRVVERVVEKIVDRPVDRIVEKMVDRQFDNPVHLARIKSLEADLAARDAELLSLRRPTAVLDKAAATAAGFKVRGMDDLEVIEGIGPKIAELFHKAGIHMFWELEKTPVTRMQEILTAAGPHYKLANPASWAQQSGLAANNRWAELKKLQDELSAGVRK
jgi:predicted flap endonuclease-1-like 5' DNA nuclease/DNA primase large subunit